MHRLPIISGRDALKKHLRKWGLKKSGNGVVMQF